MPRQRKPGRWLFLALVLAGYGVAAVIAPDLAYRACAGFVAMLEKVAPALALVFVLMLLGEMLLSNERVENWLGRGSGLRGWFLALAAVFLYARAIKLPLLPLLAHYFGLRYMIVLSLFIAAFSILNGRIMEQLERPAESA